MPENRRLAREPRTLLQRLIWQREATYEEQVDEFMKLARQLKEPATVSVRHLQRLASGERSGERATPSLRRVMRQLYGQPLDVLLGPPTSAASADRSPERHEAPAPAPAPAVDGGSDLHLDLDQLVTLDHNADAMHQLTNRTLGEPSQLIRLDVVPEAWRAAVVRWLLEPERCVPEQARNRTLTPIDVEVVRSATRMFSGWDYQYGGGRSRLLVAQCLAAEALPLVRQVNAGSALGREYLSAVSALSRLAGWTAYDIGCHGAAQRFLTLALNFAREAGDRALGGRILAGMSHQANYLGQHGRAVELARAAHEGARNKATPSAMALFHAMEARALAMLGEASECARALGTAERFLSQANPAIEPDWIHFFDAAELHAEFAHCFRDLGNAELAAEHAQLSIHGSEAIYVRSLSFCRTVLATAHVQRKDLEQALEVARGVVHTAAQLRSRRILTYLDDFRALLLPCAGDRQVQAFNEYAAAHRPRLELPPPTRRVPTVT